MNTRGAPKGASQAATAKRQAQRYLTTADRLAVQLPLPDQEAGSQAPDRARNPRPTPGFLAKAAAGKVRPAPREPGVTHYSCTDRCCRSSWSA